jgi:hypothetical protein
VDQHKTCPHCGENKPMGEYHRSKHTSDGLVGHCKLCVRNRRLEKLGRTDGKLHTPRGFRDEHGKSCPRCRKYKPWSDYQNSSKTKDGRQVYCRSCASAHGRAYYRANADKIRAKLAAATGPGHPADPAKTKICGTCGVEKPHPEFYAHRSTSDGRAGYCKECAKAYSRAYTKRNAKIIRRRQRRWLYGPAADVYDDLLTAQSHACAICGEPPQEGRNLHVDHDHDTGAIRGLLCGNCNTGLGLFKDDPELLSRATEYLAAPPGEAMPA